jgi:DNA-binding MarR family transcriptional regulator
MDETSVSCELRKLNNLIHRYFLNYSHKKQIESATGTNGWIIGYIAENPDRDIYQRDIERHFSITRSTASRVVGLMVKKGLIVRQSVPGDLRLKKLTLTDKSRCLSDIMRDDAIHMEKELTKGFTKEETDALLGYLERMKENMTPFDPDGRAL